MTAPKETPTPLQYKANTGEMVPKKCACGLDLAELHASGKEGHICSAYAGPGDARCRGEWRDFIDVDGEREVARCNLKENHDQACQSSTIPRGLWPQVISGEALETAAVRFTEAMRKVSDIEALCRKGAFVIGTLEARELAGRRRRYLRAATYDHVAALMRANDGDPGVYEELEAEAERVRKDPP